jgi:hypothetical protein
MKAKSYILLTLLYSTNILNANEYTQAVKYNDLERIEELNQGYEEININTVDDKTGLTPLQYAALYNPGVIKSLINNYEINIYKNTKSTPQSALNILLTEIESETDDQRIKSIIEIINFEKNKDFPNWDKLFKSNKEDLIYKMIDKNLYMAIYYIYKNNIEIDNKKYIEYSLNNNPAMVFYFKKYNNSNIYKKAIVKLISNNKRFDIKMLLTDGKMYEYLNLISKIEENKKTIKMLKIIKSYYKKYFHDLEKKKKTVKKIEKKPKINISSMVDLKLREYKYKLQEFKEIIENNKINNLKLQQKLKMSEKNQELEIYKYKNKYDKRLYLLRIEKEKQCDKIIQKINIKNIKNIEKYKSEVIVLKNSILSLKNEDKNKTTTNVDKIAKLKNELEEKEIEIKKLLLLKVDISLLEDKLTLSKEETMAGKDNVYNYIYLSLFFILLNLLSLFLTRTYLLKKSKSE